MKDIFKILVLLLVLVGIIFGTIKISKANIKPIITLNKKLVKNKESNEEEKKEEPKEKDSKPTEEDKPTDDGTPVDTPPETPAASTPIIPSLDNAAPAVLCTKDDTTESGMAITLQYLGSFDKVGGSLNKMTIYTTISATNLTPEEKQATATAVENSLKGKYPSFTSQSAVTETEVQVVLTGTSQDLLKDYSILDEESLEYYNFAPTLRYEGYKCSHI